MAATANVDVGPSGTTHFAPATVTIDPGDTVQWTARSANHTVTADDGSFDSSGGGGTTMTPGTTFSHTFSTPGTYRYYCRIHGGKNGIGMSGTGGVRGSSPSPSPSPPPSPPPPRPGTSSVYFAQGTVRPRFVEFITIHNPGTAAGTAPPTL